MSEEKRLPAFNAKERGAGDGDADVVASPALQCPSHTTERALVNRADLRLLPILVVIYLMSFLDRVNISNALTLGLPEELGLTTAQPNVALAIFNAPYILFEVPSNLLLRRFKPHVWLSGCMFAFGLVTLLQGFVVNYSGLLATRFFLGCAESGIFPACFYTLSMWYKRHEAQRRFTVFFSGVTLAGAFGSLLASAIQPMTGKRGLSGWRWIFILEGTLTCLIAVAAFFLIVDFPEDVKWLREDEKVFMRRRLELEYDPEAVSDRKVTLMRIFAFFRDWKPFLGVMMYFGIAITTYSLAYFTPTIVKGFGYGTIQTQLFSVPPYGAAFFCSLLVAYVSDKLRLRFPFILLGFVLWVAGLSVLLGTRDTRADYAALVLVIVGTYSALPLVICWYTMNLRGHAQRIIGTGWLIGMGNVGSIAATFTFVAGNLHAGYCALMGGFGLALLGACGYFALVLSENRRWGRELTGRKRQEKDGARTIDRKPVYNYL